MLRLFFLAILIYLLLRLARRVVLSLLVSKARTPRYPEEPELSRKSPSSGGVIDEMKRCPACGTYNPTRLAYRKKDLYFCNERCHENSIRRERNS